MNIEEKVKANLLLRGFGDKTQQNNRGLIRATIDETIIQVVKYLNPADVVFQREQLLTFTGWLFGNVDKEVEQTIVDDYLKGK